jgi:hypothetical protein
LLFGVIVIHPKKIEHENKRKFRETTRKKEKNEIVDTCDVRIVQ